MVTPPDIEAQILRYYHVEKWRVGTIAGQLHVHHSVVTRVLAQAGLPSPTAIPVCAPATRTLGFMQLMLPVVVQLAIIQARTVSFMAVSSPSRLGFSRRFFGI